MKYTYLIDGVAVPQKIYERRQEWGEHPGAMFRMVEAREKEQRFKA